MAALTIKAINPCTGGGHVTIAVTGDITRNFPFVEVDDLLDAPSADEQLIAVKVLIRLGRIGRTRSQLRALLTGPIGLVVTL